MNVLGRSMKMKKRKRGKWIHSFIEEIVFAHKEIVSNEALTYPTKSIHFQTIVGMFPIIKEEIKQARKQAELRVMNRINRTGYNQLIVSRSSSFGNFERFSNLFYSGREEMDSVTSY